MAVESTIWKEETLQSVKEMTTMNPITFTKVLGLDGK